MTAEAVEFWAILGVGVSLLSAGVTLGGFVLAGQRSIRADLATAAADREGIRADLHALGERVARIEGALWGASSASLARSLASREHQSAAAPH